MRTSILATVLSISLASVASAQTPGLFTSSQYTALTQADRKCTDESNQDALRFKRKYGFPMTKHEKKRRLVACMQKEVLTNRNLSGVTVIPTNR